MRVLGFSWSGFKWSGLCVIKKTSEKISLVWAISLLGNTIVKISRKLCATSYFRNLSTNCRRGESVTIVNAYLSMVSFALCRLICRLNVARLAIVDHFVQRVLSRVSETNFIPNFIP